MHPKIKLLIGSEERVILEMFTLELISGCMLRFKIKENKKNKTCDSKKSKYLKGACLYKKKAQSLIYQWAM